MFCIISKQKKGERERERERERGCAYEGEKLKNKRLFIPTGFK